MRPNSPSETGYYLSGLNFRDHAVESSRFKKEEFNQERPYAVYFSKRVNEATPDGGCIPSYPGLVDSLDYEAELAVIIGKEAKDVKKEDAFDYVFGYTVINDVSARNVQTRHKQWYFGKSLMDLPLWDRLLSQRMMFPDRPSWRSRAELMKCCGRTAARICLFLISRM